MGEASEPFAGQCCARGGQERIDVPNILFVLIVALAVVCAETACRFARWWWTLTEPYLLRELMLGIVFVQAGFLEFASLAVLTTIITIPALYLLLMRIQADVMILAGTFMHLRPAWRLAGRWPPPVLRIVVRCVLAIALAIAIIFIRG